MLVLVVNDELRSTRLKTKNLRNFNASQVFMLLQGLDQSENQTNSILVKLIIYHLNTSSPKLVLAVALVIL